ncbi:MAG: tRNA glutamyl-Q(34) synthetase GluQRS [Alphaproteobacteria bacterium]|nr:tRNA glutamyl-Q(34) synthetase GluQRS [Alphaproteobacteria bacterium]
MSETTRFAPSPTGYLHLGHAFAALFAAEAAGDAGTFLLRIEDIDRTRCRPEFDQAIDDDLQWLGLQWQVPVRRQSEHFAEFSVAFERLKEMQLVYPCFCTRREIAAEIQASAGAPHGPDGPIYPGTCRARSDTERRERLARGDLHAWRLDVAAARARVGQSLSFEESGGGPNGEHGTVRATPEVFGDVVLARKDVPASYHVAVVVDDALQGVTLVTRGNDLFPSTHVHRLLQALLELPAPRYRHHRLITDQSGRRFAKRDEDQTLRALRANGATPDDIRRMVGLTSR